MSSRFDKQTNSAANQKLRSENKNLKKRLGKKNSELAKTKNRNRNRRQNANKFPSGNKQGSGFNPGDHTVENQEYIQDINGSTGFNLQFTTPLNPGLQKGFFWLSEIAQNYEEYEFEYLTFVYKPMVSPYATQGQKGKILMMADFDVTDAPPGSKREMENSVPHCDGMPYDELTLSIPKKYLKGTIAKYVRTGPRIGDMKTYDLGRFFLAAQGTADNSLAGELHVHYKVRLKVPVMEATNLAPYLLNVAEFTQTDQEIVSTHTATILFNQTNINGLEINNQAGVMTLPVGSYKLTYNLKCESPDNKLTFFHCVAYKNSGIYEMKPTLTNGVSIGISSLNVTGDYLVQSNGNDTIYLRCTVDATSSETLKVTGTVIIQLV